MNFPKLEVVKGEFYTFLYVDGKRVALLYAPQYAQLFAAAPEMLEALETISDFLEANGHPREAAEARAVINKARGDK